MKKQDCIFPYTSPEIDSNISQVAIRYTGPQISHNASKRNIHLNQLPYFIACIRTPAAPIFDKLFQRTSMHHVANLYIFRLSFENIFLIHTLFRKSCHSQAEFRMHVHIHVLHVFRMRFQQETLIFEARSIFKT